MNAEYRWGDAATSYTAAQQKEIKQNSDHLASIAQCFIEQMKQGDRQREKEREREREEEPPLLWAVQTVLVHSFDLTFNNNGKG